MNSTSLRDKITKRLFGDSLLWRLLRESVPEHKGKYAAAIAAMILVAATTALSAWIMGALLHKSSEDRGYPFPDGLIPRLQ